MLRDWADGRGDVGEWVEETVDLSPYKRKTIQIRFSLKIHDVFTNFELDDVRVVESRDEKSGSKR